jgi:hypothetical protein
MMAYFRIFLKSVEYLVKAERIHDVIHEMSHFFMLTFTLYLDPHTHTHEIYAQFLIPSQSQR